MNLPEAHQQQRRPRPEYDVVVETSNLPEQVLATVANYQNKVCDYLFEISWLEGLTSWKKTKTLPAEFMKYFEKALDLYDESVNYLLSYLRHQGISIHCTPGCTHCCCHMPVGISTAELIYLYYGMHRSGVFPRIFRRCMEAEEEWREILKTFSNLPPDQDRNETIRERTLSSYHCLGHYCPFLQDHLCRVYPYRPIACRMHFSISPPHWCNPSHFQHDYATRFNLEPGENVLDALEHLENRLQLKVSDTMVGGILELSINVMKFEEISWIN